MSIRRGRSSSYSDSRFRMGHATAQRRNEDQIPIFLNVASPRRCVRSSVGTTAVVRDGLDVSRKMNVGAASESGVAFHFPPHSKASGFPCSAYGNPLCRDGDGSYEAGWEPALPRSNSLANRLNLRALLSIQVIQMMAKRRIRNQWAMLAPCQLLAQSPSTGPGIV